MTGNNKAADTALEWYTVIDLVEDIAIGLAVHANPARKITQLIDTDTEAYRIRQKTYLDETQYDGPDRTGLTQSESATIIIYVWIGFVFLLLAATAGYAAAPYDDRDLVYSECIFESPSSRDSIKNLRLMLETYSGSGISYYEYYCGSNPKSLFTFSWQPTELYRSPQEKFGLPHYEIVDYQHNGWQFIGLSGSANNDERLSVFVCDRNGFYDIEKKEFKSEFLPNYRVYGLCYIGVYQVNFSIIGNIEGRSNCNLDIKSESISVLVVFQSINGVTCNSGKLNEIAPEIISILESVSKM